MLCHFGLKMGIVFREIYKNSFHLSILYRYEKKKKTGEFTRIFHFGVTKWSAMHANHKVRRQKDDGTDLTVWSETERDRFQTGHTLRRLS